VTGFVGKPSVARARGAIQLLAVNRRPVRSRLVSAAIRSGYGELLPRDRQPVVFLLLEIEGPLVDVNVHPTKREVRFGETQRVYGAIEAAVRKGLMSGDPTPAFAVGAAPGRGTAADRASAGRAGGPSAAPELPLGSAIRERPVAAEGFAAPETEPEDVKFWQLHRSYIFIQTREGVLVVDQHAAHERVLYERARSRLSGAADGGPSQQLLFPVTVELSPTDWQAFEEVNPFLTKLGFVARALSGRTVLLEAVPGAFSKWPQDRILQDILADLPAGRPALRDLIESIARTFACKTAIKAGDRLREEEMRALIDQLFATELPYSCPHGRPTFMRIALPELEKRFGRT
jgi:DNA mismatch repair protein MutL